MKTFRTLIFIASLALSVSHIQAQKSRGKTKVKAKAPVHAVQGAAQETSRLYRSLLPATAKVMFIDSVVVPKSNFLSYLPLNKESGTLSISDNNKWMACYENELGDRRIFAQGDTATSTLYTQTLLGNGWEKAAKLADLSETVYRTQNYPFLCSDGITLFFSANSEEGVGKRDIFMTIYDTDKGEWYNPQNYGLPFNSTANDYLLAINDLDTLGWLVSDRYQPEDSVCIYTFVPTVSRQDFSADGLSDTQLEAYAKVASIKETWRFGNRQQAMRRRDAMLKRMKSNNVSGRQGFVVNDSKVITSASQLAKEESRHLYGQLQKLIETQRTICQTLDDYRKKYSALSPEEKATLRPKMLQMEQDLVQHTRDIKQLEKEIRRIEWAP